MHSLGFLSVYFICLQFLNEFQLFLDMYLILIGASLGGCAFGIYNKNILTARFIVFIPGLSLSALFPTIQSIHLFIVPLELVCLLLSGLWIKVGSLPQLFATVKYFSPFYVSFESLCIVYWMRISGIGPINVCFV